VIRSVGVAMVLGAAFVAGCSLAGKTGGESVASASGGHDGSGASSADGGHGGALSSSSSTTIAASGGSRGSGGSGGSAPCTTRVSYGDRWIRPDNHPNDFDDASGEVSWDGACTNDGKNSFAVLSNGWKPYFKGHFGCVIALDGSCANGACATRVTYDTTWIPVANHPNQFDDVTGRVFWDQSCSTQGQVSDGVLSNGWDPHFTGKNACAMSFRFQQCGGLYQNSVSMAGCADPGVLAHGGKYFVACTSGDAANAFPISTSTDLVHWTSAGHVFASAQKPSWATGDFWAPEIHAVGSGFVAYFSARNQDGKLSIGAATATNELGPFTDIGQPLIHDPNMGLIDASEFEDDDGSRYVIWKEDGNAVGKPTPIHAQKLGPNGTTVVDSPSTLITNDQAWEGAVVEGPWLIKTGGFYYLFYSGNSYANGSYALGVARASAPLGPYTKAGDPIVVTNDTWVGPGHCSVVTTPGGDTALVYHAWAAGHVNGPGDARRLLVDEVIWSNGWPKVPEAPSVSSRPVP
jgi:arabinan endo-1,5-alpha-L-arabinosidase